MRNTTVSNIFDLGAVATQRLFFALWPEAGLQRQFYAQAGSLLAGHPGRPVAAANLHLTLVFLGSVTEEVRPCLEQAAAGVQGAPFSLVFDQVGYWRRPRVLWFGCSETPAPLISLVDALNTGIAGCGLAPETRPYQAHLTVARKVQMDMGHHPLPPITWPVARFALVESHTSAEGVEYRPVRMWRL